MAITLAYCLSLSLIICPFNHMHVLCFSSNVHICFGAGPETSLISLTSLPYGTYLVPLKIADQQGVLTHAAVQVSVCNCAKGEMCRDLQPRSINLHRIATGILLGALLLMACKCFHERYNYSHTSYLLTYS